MPGGVFGQRLARGGPSYHGRRVLATSQRLWPPDVFREVALVAALSAPKVLLFFGCSQGPYSPYRPVVSKPGFRPIAGRSFRLATRVLALGAALTLPLIVFDDGKRGMAIRVAVVEPPRLALIALCLVRSPHAANILRVRRRKLAEIGAHLLRRVRRRLRRAFLDQLKQLLRLSEGRNDIVLSDFLNVMTTPFYLLSNWVLISCKERKSSPCGKWRLATERPLQPL